MAVGDVEGVVGLLATGADALLALDLDTLTGREAMALTRAVEGIRRRIDAGTDRLAGHLDETGKFGVDGHRSAKDAITFVGRLPSAEAHARVHTARRLKHLPGVAGAHQRGEISTDAVRAISNLAGNPRVAPPLDDVIDELFVEQARTQSHQAFVAWLRDLERAADQDGAGVDAETTHKRRRTQFTQSATDGSYELRSSGGSLHAAVIGDVLAAFEAAELEADRAEAIERHGPSATPDQYRRTALQRRTDALVAIFRMAAAAPGAVQVPEPLVNVVIDAETLEDELARVTGGGADQARPTRRPAASTRSPVGGSARRCPADRSIPAMPSPACSSAWSAGSSSTAPRPSSTWDASADASPAPPAMPPTCRRPSADEVRARASGVTAPAPRTDNSVTTSGRGVRSGAPTSTTATSPAATTTA